MRRLPWVECIDRPGRLTVTARIQSQPPHPPRNLLLSIGHVEMGEPQQVVIFALEIIHRVHLADDPSDAVAAHKAKTPSGDEWN
jgi:hypothetical protein